ncbi:MAG TPA: DNA ligase D [Burkholderiales bacterium]
MVLQARRRKDGLPRRREPTVPRLLRPQLAILVDRPPSGPEWLHEIKYDGYRVLARSTRAGVRLYTRNGNDLTNRMAAVARAAAALPGLGDGWLDGEVVALEADGRASFPALQAALSEHRDHDLVYYLFDMPYARGLDLTGEALLERKRRLAELLEAVPSDERRLRYSDHLQGDGAAFYEHACRFGLEGVVSKRVAAPYRSGRGHEWAKTKCRLRQEFIVCGYTAPQGARAGLGALVLGVHDAGGRLVYAGRTGTGFDARVLPALRPRLEKLRVPEPPFPELPAREARSAVTWVAPRLVIEAEFAGWTRDNIARQASFRGIREDKSPREVVREVAQPLPPADAAPAAAVEAARAATRQLTHPEKVLFPEQGLTKRDVASYYAAVADWMLPHVTRRPLMLLRCPDGRHRQCFFQKHARDAPAQLLRVAVEEAHGRRAQYLALDSLQGLLALVQLGALEVHVWSARIDRLERPDQLLLDLDPDEALAWPQVLEAARRVRERLRALGLAAFVRTTGGKGLHVVAPLARRHDWTEVKAFARALAEDIARQDPTRYTAQAARAARSGRIYLDWLRNARGATAIASYSPRARAGAPVATPLAWEELAPDREPQGFNVRTVPARLQALRRDPWHDFDALRRPLTAAMRRALGVRV